jgi:hypothetical protein
MVAVWTGPPVCAEIPGTRQRTIPVVEQAIETAALMLGTDKSCGYCLELICADFLAGATLDGGDPELLLQSQRRFFRFLGREQQERFIAELTSPS